MKSFIILIILILSINIYGQKGTQDPETVVSNLINLSQDARKTNRIKSLSYIQEALKLEDKLSDSSLIKLYEESGIIYKDIESYYMALSFFYKEFELTQKHKPSESFFVLNNIGGCYYLLGEKSKARNFWEKSMKGFESFSKKNVKNSQNVEGSLIYNNLAVLEKEEGNYAKALEMLKEFKSQNTILQDTLNVIMAHENLADVYVKLNEKNTAIKEIKQGLNLAGKLNSTYDLSSLYRKLGEIHLNFELNKDSALYYLKNAYELSDNHGFIDLKLSTAELLVSLYEREKNYEQALKYLHTAKNLSEETLGTDNSKRLNRLEFEFNSKMKQNELIQSQKTREIYLIAGIVLLLLLIAIALLMFRLQKNKTQKRVAENLLLAKQLEEKNKELSNNAIKMIQASGIIESAHKEFNEIKSKSVKPSNKILSQIISDLKKGSQVFNKAEFEKLFMETDGDFYKRLLDKFPNLTKNELRLCAFLRLNLSSKEISAITHQSPHSIVVARSRLRKKLNLDESQSLTNFLVQL